MPKKNKELEDRLQTIEYLLAGILLKREPNIKEVAKIIGCSDNILSALYPGKKKIKNGKKDSENPVVSDTKSNKENVKGIQE